MDKFGKQGAKWDITPTDRHMGIASAERELVGLDFFSGIHRMAKIVMDMAMSDKGGNILNFGNYNEAIKMGRKMQMAEIQGHTHIVPVNLNK